MTGTHRDPIVTDRTKEAIILIAIIFVVIFLVGMILFNSFAKDGDGDKEVPLFADEIPTIVEIQTLIGCEKIDGIIGLETIEKWKLAINQQHAARYNWMYQEVKK